MKKKFLALAMASAVMLTGAGYAYWNDTLQINNSVATGNLDVHFVNNQSMTRGGDDQNPVTGGNNYWDAYVKHEGLGFGGPTTTISSDGNTVNTVVTNMYPGAYAQYYGIIENDGTIPAVIDTVDVTFKGKDGSETLTEQETELKNNLRFAFGYVITDKDGNKLNPNSLSGDQRWYASGTSMDNFESQLNTLLHGVRLEPNQRLSLDFPSEADAKAAMEAIGYPWNEEMHCITYTMNPQAANDTEDQQLSIGITINWTQHNDPLVTGNQKVSTEAE